MLSLIAVLLLMGSKAFTVSYVESNNRDADSFSSTALWMGVTAGILMLGVAVWTYKVHIVAGIIPFGVGATTLGVCAYLLWCQGGI